MNRIVLLALALAACGHPCPPAQPLPTADEHGLSLAWSMTVDGDRLRIDYTIENDTEERIYLLDQLIHGDAIDPDAIIVMNADTPGVVLFTRALVRTRAKTLTEFGPVARPVEAGASATGRAYATWPLTPYHNFSMVDPLWPGASRAILRIAYTLDLGPDGFRTMDLPAGPVPTAARVDDMLLLDGAPQTLPD
jgi:hypothetical protein